MLTIFEAGLVIVVPLTWTVLAVAFQATNTGFAYFGVETRKDAQQDLVSAQPTAASVAALVFAGLALVGQGPSEKLADLLLLSLACFVIVYATGFWPEWFTAQFAGDALQWIGLATFLGAVYEFALTASHGLYGSLAVLLAMAAVAALSARAAYAHWHNARDLALERRSTV